MGKLAGIDIIKEDDELTVRFATDRLEHEASRCQLRNLAHVLEVLRGGSIDDFMLPNDIELRAVAAHEVRLQLPTGERVLYDKVTGTAKIVLPCRHWGGRFWKFCVHVTDRGPIVNCAMASLLRMGVVMAWAFGAFHSQWNALKRMRKRTASGALWKAAIEMIVVYKLNIGPVNSHQWFRGKQEHLKRFCPYND